MSHGKECAKALHLKCPSGFLLNIWSWQTELSEVLTFSHKLETWKLYRQCHSVASRVNKCLNWEVVRFKPFEVVAKLRCLMVLAVRSKAQLNCIFLLSITLENGFLLTVIAKVSIDLSVLKGFVCRVNSQCQLLSNLVIKKYHPIWDYPFYIKYSL